MPPHAPATHAVDPGRLIDEGAWSTYQKLLIFGTAMTIIVDGLDNQLLPNAVPALIREWGVPRGAFTTALAIGPFGMMIGGLLGGLAGDRFGRRPTLIGCVALFGALTCLMALIDSIAALSTLRLLAGVGLGGALAGELAAFVIPRHGWRALFLVGGALALGISAVLWKLIPESPKFLARHRDRWSELTALLRRSGHDVPADTTFAVPSELAVAPMSRDRIASLFRGGFARDTVALSAAFFFGLMVNYVVVLLLPAMLTGASIGFSQPAASRALAMSNYGGIAGALLGAVVLQRLGSRLTMLTMSACAVVCGVILAGWNLDPARTGGLMAMLLLTGGLLNGVQTTMYALAAHVYPTPIRSTGVGLAVAVGRIGNVVAAYAASAAIDRGGPPAYFTLWSVLMLLVLVALACLRRHVPAADRRAA
jgi:AAHS family 4-hydroxybenzoate transporter-like MFS transporter